MTTGEWITIVVVVAGAVGNYVANYVTFTDSVKVLRWRVRRIENHFASERYKPLPPLNGDISL